MPLNNIPIFTTFYISVQFNRKHYTYRVEKVTEEGLIEFWKVYGSKQDLLFACNRLVWRNRNVKHNDYTMRLVEGQLMYKSLEEEVIGAIKNEIKKLENFK